MYWHLEFLDQSVFGLLEGHGEDIIGEMSGGGSGRTRRVRGQEIFLKQDIAGGHDHAPFDDIFQFPDIARPVPRQQMIKGFPADSFHLLAVNDAVFFDEMGWSARGCLPSSRRRGGR